jgi:PAS domain S-box-containing protein
MFMTGSGASIGRIGRSTIEPQHLRLGLVIIAVTLTGASGLIFDASTPWAVSVTLFYVAMVFVGIWLPQPKAPLALALLATPLIIIGYWLSPRAPAAAWEAWTNRGLSVCVVWLAAVFVWRFRVVEHKLHRQIDIASGLSGESRLLVSIVESSDDIIISKNLDGIITSWNRSAERLFGYAAEEVIGKPITIIIPLERRDEEDMILGHIRRGERVDHYETVRQRKDGGLLEVSLTVSPVRNDGGKVIGASKIARDITAQKDAVKLLRRQADLLDQSHDAILSWKIGNGITYWSKGAEKLYGYTSEEAIGRVNHDLLQTRGQIAMQDIERLIVQQGSWHGELNHITRDGREIVVDSRIVRVNYDGELYALETNRDITERKDAEEELRKSEERFKSSVIQSPVPTILFDDQEQILAVSRSWLDAAGGLSAEELQRMEDWTIRAFGERSREILELVRRVIATEPQARPDELTILSRDGGKRIWHFVTSGLGTKSDGRRLFVSMAQDVTDLRAYEERIDLLMREARHRTKNILGLVQAIARQIAADDAQDFIGRFAERIQALAANQDLLVRHAWQRIDVKDLVQVQLRLFADLIGTRINFGGPNLHLNAAAAQALGLALHELTTNAGKYGALSTDAGRVDVNWHLDDHTFTMSWIESSGPPVRPPERRGFGSTVIESMAKQTLDGEVKLDYAPAGLQWRLTCSAADALEGEG